MRGTAVISTDPAELASARGARARCRHPCSPWTVERIYFQCARASKRSRLWDSESRADPRTLPSAGRDDARGRGFRPPTPRQRAYDAALDERQNATLY